ncbi:MAG: phosphate ABC transporter permease PtsA, partial [Ramlibacter sp.]
MNTAISGTGDKLLRAAELNRVREQKYAVRKRVNKVALALSLAAMVFGVFWLVWILWETVRLGVGGLAWATLTQMTPPPNEVGGIANAIYGSFLM